MAKALGCTGVTTERNDTSSRARVAPFADKHKIWVGFHNHTEQPAGDGQDTMPSSISVQFIGFNLDIGHYVAGIEGACRRFPCSRSITTAS